MPPLLISFPEIDPVLIQLGPLAIRWYALAYIAGIMIGWWYAKRIIRWPRAWAGAPPPLTSLDFDDFILWVTFGIILGGRIGYVFFYDPAHFAANPMAAFKLWEGGMSFHGGYLGCVAAVVGFSLWRNLPMLTLGDITCAVGPIGLFFGRIANFINGELWGRPTDVAWAMIFPHAGPLPRHPSQLYEAALEGALLFVVLFLCVRAGALRRPGLILGLFTMGYAVTRSFCELFREPDAQIGYLWGGMTRGMQLSFAMFAIGVVFTLIALLRKPPLNAAAKS
ncbi:prolipoprotein diacylglyceryl transferase [Variibacter gotjawalensis]|uniref:Phosphatidylglycerol--prolipoprotein diacylglyceryl transferase n=1 Tax=Variibacter gotjawalensis TaxID=1333996 RepID=A0A0S3PTD9_9BRAD|nr:prolipoprotein diacylglyceryl transferase [Variibacter gotjawalensis]NIK49542.1 phosphatidylglycerol:prolipoprotein diacylglycerol transferase [Variibacter gotjawalensis]RZS51393.1 prolipoprotein diacylglyceryl transferase [Variibacter gotjawalensis]BAT59226.1 prolipoprotein diacylglyceryl transferase [Variibacter gotjawalensis]